MVDIFLTGYRGFIGSQISQELNHRSLKFIKVDKVQEIRRRDGSAIVINAIGKGMASHTELDLDQIHVSNYEIPISIAKICAEKEWRFLQIGSYPADYKSENTPYLNSKRKASQALREILPVKLLTVLSPDLVLGNHSKSFLSRLYFSMVNDPDFKLHNPEQIRNFIHVELVAKTIVDLATLNEFCESKPLISPTNWKISDFYTLIRETRKHIHAYSGTKSTMASVISNKMSKFDFVNIQDAPILELLIEFLMTQEENK